VSGVTDIAIAPLLPLWLIIGLGVAAALVMAYGVFIRSPGVPWRSLAALAIILTLLNPSLTEEQRQSLADIALIVVDRSPSQSLEARTAQTDLALKDLQKRFAALSDLELRIIETTTSETSGELTGLPRDGTHLFATLERGLSDIPRSQFAGAVMITDGQIHDRPAAEGADNPAAPLHGLLTGRPNEQDRRIVIENMPTYGIVGQKLDLSLRIEDSAAAEGSSDRVEVLLRQDGGKSERQTLPVNQTVTIPMTIGHGGPNILELEVAAGDDELTDRNNRTVAAVNGVRDRLRVLLVSGEPHAGERVWRNLLKADPAVDLVHFTILRPPEKQDGTPINELSLIAFPIRELFEIKLNEFDLIIFDRYRRRGVLPHAYLRNIAKYVKSGGALLEAAGPPFASALSLYRTPLAEVLPGAPTGEIIEAGFRPALTDLGRRHPVTGDLVSDPADANKWGRWFRLIDVEPTRGKILMSGINGAPILIADRIGEGRVAQLLSDHAWLWARGFEGGGPQAELLRRVAHWLMKEPDLEEEDLNAVAEAGRLSIVRRSLQEDNNPVTVITPSGERRHIDMAPGKGGRTVGHYAARETGLYKLQDGQRRTVVAVGTVNPKEFADVRSTDRILKPIVDAAGGGLMRLSDGALPRLRRVRADAATAGKDWLGFVRNRDYVVTGIRQISLLPPLAVLIFVLGGLLLAWWREGR